MQPLQESAFYPSVNNGLYISQKKNNIYKNIQEAIFIIRQIKNGIGSMSYKIDEWFIEKFL